MACRDKKNIAEWGVLFSFTFTYINDSNMTIFKLMLSLYSLVILLKVKR